jgi:hypothetical protein
MTNIPKKSFSFKPTKGIFPVEETIDGKTETIMYCGSEKMTKDLISKMTLLDCYQDFLESMANSNLSGDDMREAIRNRLKYPPDFEKPY